MGTTTAAPSLFFATPAFGGMFCAAYVNALLAAFLDLKSRGVPAQFAWSHSSLVQAGRDLLAARFLASDATHLVFVDADEGRWTATDVLAMVGSGYPVCGAVVPMKVIDWPRVAEAARRGVPPAQLASAGARQAGVVHVDPKVKIIDGRPFAECASVGTGLLTIERGVFAKLAPVAPEYVSSATSGEKARHFFPVEVVDGRLKGEDEGFCRLWRGVGGRIGCLLDARVSHVGPYEFQPPDLRALFGEHRKPGKETPDPTVANR